MQGVYHCVDLIWICVVVKPDANKHIKALWHTGHTQACVVCCSQPCCNTAPATSREAVGEHAAYQLLTMQVALKRYVSPLRHVR